MRVYTDSACERHVNVNSPVEVPARYPAAMAGVETAERAGMNIERHPCRPAPEEALAAVHAPAYLEELERLSASGGGYLDPDTALGPGSWEVASLAAGAAVDAVEGALAGEASFAVTRPPGHHAGPDYGMGFCLINNTAVAAAHALSRGVRRVAILDWDVHHGNGTQDIFYESDEVLYLSTHRGRFYPGTGAVREVGEGRGRGFTVNAPLGAGSGEDLYAEVFAGLFIPILHEFQPELVIVSAGYDAHSADPLGGMRLEAGTFGRFAAALAHLTRDIETAPLALILEGGYNLEALTSSVAATIEGIEKEEAPAWEYSRARPVRKSRKALAPFWKSLG